MEFSEKVLVLQVGKFREADVWVRFLSPSRGLVSAFAFGGSRSRRRFVGCLDVFNEIHVRMKGSGRNQYLALQEGVLVKGVERLRTDWARFGMAANCVRFLQCFGVGPEGAKEALALMQNVLLLLEEHDAVSRLLPLFFRLRLAFEQGYAIEFDVCAECASPFIPGEVAWLFLQEGHLLCQKCAARQSGYSLALSTECRAALRVIAEEPPSVWPVLSGLSDQTEKAIGRAADGFIQYHVGISWENGRFVRR